MNRFTFVSSVVCPPQEITALSLCFIVFRESLLSFPDDALKFYLSLYFGFMSRLILKCIQLENYSILSQFLVMFIPGIFWGILPPIKNILPKKFRMQLRVFSL